jgi:hypothetical protein
MNCNALAIRSIAGAARRRAALGGSGCDRHERVGEHVWVEQVVQGMPLFATLQSDFHWQYLSRANTRWTCNPCHFFLPLGVGAQGAMGVRTWGLDVAINAKRQVSSAAHCSIAGGGSLLLLFDVGRPNDLAPFFGFMGDELAKNRPPIWETGRRPNRQAAL